MQRFTRWAFWGAVVFTLIMATLPKPPQLPGAPSDKIQHIVAFLVLSALAALAYQRASIWRIGIALSCFGASIEIVQAIPSLHRDSDIVDWTADTLAVAAVLVSIEWWRRRSRGTAAE